MWISSKTFVELSNARAQAEGQTHALVVQITALNTTMDWMRVRLNQVEQERADLIEKYMGVKIQVPQIEPISTDTSEVLNQSVSFEDMGDDEAARQGYGWNEDGEVINTRN
jgi:hypothetical protein